MAKRILAAVIAGFLLQPGLSLASSQGNEILKGKCAECHALSKPEETSRARTSSRKGQDLYYAGSKYNKEWLVKWLQNPNKIRPSGGYGEVFTKDLSKGPSTHLKLSSGEAESVSLAMMELKAPTDVVVPGIYENDPNNVTDGLSYYRNNGCLSCHQLAPDMGGKLAPELYTAGERMQPDYIASFIRHPKKFDPYVNMPNLFKSTQAVQKITGYLLKISASKSIDKTP
jgi:cytochrome c2